MTKPKWTSESGLVECIDELSELTTELRDELPFINDEQLHSLVVSLVDTAGTVFEAHRPDPKPSIADDLAVLMSAVRAIRIPTRDPDIGRTPTLDRLRKSKGLIVAGLADALDLLAAIGLLPQRPPLPAEIAMSLPRSEIEGMLSGTLARLTQIEKSLDALDGAKALSTDFSQQRSLLHFYTSGMRAEVDLAKLHIAVSNKTLDFSALARAIETMAGLTGDFIATVKAWGARVADQIIAIASTLPRQVRKVASAVKVTASWIVRIARMRHATILEQEPPQLSTLVAHDVPPDFDQGSVREMILAGQAPPEQWSRFITELDFAANAKLHHLAPIARLAELKVLYLSETKIGDLMPLKSLTRLQILDLRKTDFVRDLTPLASLASLEWLNLDGTHVINFAPLAGLTSLRTLDLRRTHVSDLSALAGLTGLQSLDLRDTRVHDLTPLADLSGLRSLNLQGTQVSDLAPLSRLTSLQSLDLQATQISDLAPLARLTHLRSLDLRGTQISDLTPLARLANLQELYLQGTQIRDLAPLAGLTGLDSLYLRGTQVSDLTQLGGLTRLQLLDLEGTRVSDLAPLASLAGIQELYLRGTQVNDLAPVAHVAKVIMPDGSMRDRDKSPRRHK